MGDLAHHTALLRAARRLLLVAPPGDPRDFAPIRQRLRHALPHATLIPFADPFTSRAPAPLPDPDPFTSRAPAPLPDLDPFTSRAPAPLPDLERAPAPRDVTTDPAALFAHVDHLAAARLDAVLIFTVDGDSPFELAYLAYLAGIPVRAGQSAEFGGGVLAPWIRPPPHGTPPLRRHHALLDALGL